MKTFIFEDDKERVKFFKKLMFLFNSEYYITDRYYDAISALSKNEYDLAFLDHDIEGEKYTGHDIAKYINERNVKIKRIIIHSLNPPGAKRMNDELDNSEIIPFTKIYSIYSKEVKGG